MNILKLFFENIDLCDVEHSALHHINPIQKY